MHVYNLCEFSCSICKVIGTLVHLTSRQLLMIMKQNTSVFYLGFKTTYMYLHDTLIILVETNLHVSCPGSGVVIGSYGQLFSGPVWSYPFCHIVMHKPPCV